MSAQRNHACRVCDARFTTKSHMNYHIRNQHEWEGRQPKHVCHICGAGFTLKMHMTRHIKTVQHEPNGQHTCKMR